MKLLTCVVALLGVALPGMTLLAMTLLAMTLPGRRRR